MLIASPVRALFNVNFVNVALYVNVRLLYPELFGVQLVVIDLITRSDRRLNSGTTGVRSPWHLVSSLTVIAANFVSIVVTVV